ncbi:anthocyanidin reductase ((2S)-flavan-3-ol-forming)-like [Prunus avium]|uniref:Anthocyanidin reductase ((2S)-flavan-3-ol-forming)-like n=1 Tax=Prunus avium TaxID=42229 RepID=A0A6P5RT41_PRUAV|nr:anthocyanidin reductase ((2S)-flavan-3-ol-forming)-like [Prunus avium]
MGLLKGLPNAQERLRLFEADIYNPYEFEPAIQGCKYIFHLATPLQHEPKDTQFKNTSEAAVSGLNSIVRSCIKSGTVKRLIYTASVAAASPIKDSGIGFQKYMDESCWTPLNLLYPLANQTLMDYTHSKTLSEKEVLRHISSELEVVSIACGLVGGDTLLSVMPESMGVLISQIASDKRRYQTLRFLEDLLGKVPIVHIEDVCEAHILCIEKSCISGRFLCASAYLSSAEIASHWKTYYPDIRIAEEFVEDLGREIVWGSTELEKIGFEYKFDAKVILDETLKWAQKMGEFGSSQEIIVSK